MKKKFILALDQGTSSSRAVLFDEKFNIIAIEQAEFPQYYPKSGWVEHEPEEIWTSQWVVVQKLLQKSNILPSEIAAIGITNQRETTIVWDKKSGRPIYRAIVWQDKRTSETCDKLKSEGWQDIIKNKTGLVIDSYFSATKLAWILNNVPEAKKKANNGELAFGTVDTWLIWKLSSAKYHVTDFSNASRTMLFNLNSLQWDNQLLDLFEIPVSVLPEVKKSSEIICTTTLFGDEIPIAGIAGDQQAALFGQNCFEPGTAKNTYGTGCFMLMNTGNIPVSSKSGLLTTIAWGIDNQITYALEGSVFIAGAAIKWLRDGLHLIQTASETELISQELETSEGVYVVPAFAGLGAPYWDMFARGAIMGLTQGITEKHIVRATLESLAYQTKDVLDAMTSDSNINLKALNVDGGASANNFLMQFQSDILNCKVVRPQNIETTALGAAFLAGLASNFCTTDEINLNREINRIFTPTFNKTKRDKLYKGWLKALDRVRNWEKE